MIPARTAAAALLAGLPAGSQAAESAYTGLDADTCTVISRQEEGDGVEMRCLGFKGVPVFFSEGDLRADVDFGALDGVFSTLGPFNSIGGKIEWRHAGGKPFAAILRYRLDAGTGEADARGDVLLVSKVGRAGAPGCPMAAVDVRLEQANGIARGVAALAPGFDCKTGRPVAIGPPNSLATSFSGAAAEGE